MPTTVMTPGTDAPAGLLGVLQYADSLFPSGASAFSWGLESLHIDGMADTAVQILGLSRALVAHRWVGFDRPLLRAAYQAAGDLEAQFALDRLCEAMTLCEVARTASRRLGFTQLRVHAELGLPAAAAYLERVRADCAPGHLPVMQGLVWQAQGLTLNDCESMSAFGLCLSVAGAAMRLGLLGHIDAQRLLTELRTTIRTAIDSPPVEQGDLWSGAPALEIAAMRHEPRAARLFAN